MADSGRVLVAYGTKHGATAEIAEAIARTLRQSGLQVDVERARRVHSLVAYRAVVLGSAVYAARWRRDARRLLANAELRDRDVWLFSSGPVGQDEGDPKQAERWTKPQRVQRRAAELGVHEHVVFGGRLDESSGFIARKMAQKIPPQLRDRRDWEQIEAWARSIAAALGAGGGPSGDGGQAAGDAGTRAGDAELRGVGDAQSRASDGGQASGDVGTRAGDVSGGPR